MQEMNVCKYANVSGALQPSFLMCNSYRYLSAMPSLTNSCFNHTADNCFSSCFAERRTTKKRKTDKKRRMALSISPVLVW